MTHPHRELAQIDVRARHAPLPLRELPQRGKMPARGGRVVGGGLRRDEHEADARHPGRAGERIQQAPQPIGGHATLSRRARQIHLHQAVLGAARRVVPPLLNDFIGLTKDVALVSVLGPQEIVRVAQISSDFSFNYTPYIAAAAIYLLLTLPLIRIVDRQQRRALRRQNAVVML